MSGNRLASATSSYLRSAAHQPVDWHPWGADAFAKAQAEDKPILLDIGAVWCHWCHVMDRESYEDTDLARIINDQYVAVKVDRDERPDVDARYQKAIQAMTGQGGWPLTAFLLPDGRVFYGGTYFPPVEAHGRPSFRRVLESVAEAYRTRRSEILQNADQLTEHLRGRGPARGVREVHESQWDELVAHAVSHARELFDVTHGGFGRAPKFPHPAAHDLLLERALRGDATARDMLVATLDGMREGGIYDQVGGGFHRYSVDERWLVPHFEKMLYDNAGLLRNYARAAAALGRADYARTARETADWMRNILGQREGGAFTGFGGSQDADVGLEDDGDFFTWTLEELHVAVDDEGLARLMAEHYGVEEKGDMHHDARRNVLEVAADAQALAAALGRSAADVEADLERGRRLLATARAQRQAPFVDPIRYTNWNGMGIQALLEYGGLLGDADADKDALAALDTFLREAYAPEKGFARTPGSATFGMLDDNAQMLAALLEAHFATGEPRYLRAAREVGDLLLARFAHPQAGFVDRAPGLAPEAESAALAEAERPLQDAPTASPNGVALHALLRLSEATGEARFGAFARTSLARLGPEVSHLSVFGGAMLLAMDAVQNPAPRIVLPRGEAGAFRAVARRAARPGATFHAPGDEHLPEEAKAYAGPGALVCVGTRCLPPAKTPAALEADLKRLAVESAGAGKA